MGFVNLGHCIKKTPRNVSGPKIFLGSNFRHTDEKYPFGKREWTIVNDTCSTEETEKKVLNLSPCDSSSFTCDDGICIPMTSRCDQKLDCEDVSDEKNCKIVILDEKSYLKDKPPPPLGGLDIVDVKIRMELYNILEISEVTSVFRTQYKLFMEWKDPRITFWNLKNDTTLNIMTSSEKESIWMPTLMFFNTDKKSRTIMDQETLVYIKKGGQFSINEPNEIDNIYLNFFHFENQVEQMQAGEDKIIDLVKDHANDLPY